jgi:hypothetical protein
MLTRVGAVAEKKHRLFFLPEILLALNKKKTGKTILFSEEGVF